MGPLARGIGMRRCGNDNLHLIYLNFFKHLFKYTIHESLPDSKKKIVRDYVKAAGFYSYDAADDSDDPVKRWIGREVKRFLHEADQHLPFLLNLSSTDIDVCAETADAMNSDGEELMDVSGDDFEASDAEVAAEAARPDQLILNSERWDRYLAWVREIETPWVSDTDSYRQQRALQYANFVRACSRDLLDCKPTMASWVPHIACNIAPRQIVDLGDPTRRAADACESYGACVKTVIKTLTCQRKIQAGKFGRGYIEQAFRRLAVRASLIHGEQNVPYLQRDDARLCGAGRFSSAPSRVEGPSHSIRVKVEQAQALE